jgi:hypothetical protein
MIASVFLRMMHSRVLGTACANAERVVAALVRRQQPCAELGRGKQRGEVIMMVG